jgi:membrane fusion protein, multidrug efflux system
VPETHHPAAPARAPRAARLRWLVGVVVVLVASAGLVVLRTHRVGAEREQRERTAALGPRVLVTRVGHVTGARQIELPASIHGFVETAVYAKTAGYLKTIAVDKGDRVRTGMLLAELESPELEHQVANMEADYAIKELTDRRDETVAKAGALSRQEADAAHADALKAKALLDQSRALLAYTRIVAPFDGVVTARYYDPGALVPEATSPGNGTPILELATNTPVRVYANVPQNQTPYVKDGDPARVAVVQYPGRAFTGTVTRHPEALAPDSRTMLVEVDLPNDDGALLPGMYGTLRLQVAQADVPRVPDDALVFRDGKVFVPTVRDGRLHLNQVTLGDDNGATVEIVDGLSADEPVALNLGQAARDGDPVQPVEEAPTMPNLPASPPPAPAEESR